MHRLLLATALLAVCSSPALADWRKTQSKANQTHVSSAYKHRGDAQETERRRKFEETYVDPYWQPCDYTTNWGPNACGGGN